MAKIKYVLFYCAGNTCRSPFAEAYAKAELGSTKEVPSIGRALISVRNSDKARVAKLAKNLIELGYEIDATHGTMIMLQEAGINARLVNKVHEGRPHILDRIKNDEYNYIVNTTEGRVAIEDSRQLRRAALRYKVNYTTTLNGAFATCQAHLADPTADEATVNSVQELHKRITG